MWGALTALHALAAIWWVGGMAFTLLILHPASQTLAPADRIRLSSLVFKRFLGTVWLAIIVLYATGTGLIIGLYGGMASTPLPVHFMLGVALVMTLLFVALWFGPYAVFRRAVAASDVPAAAAAGAKIRRIVAANLSLGLFAAILGGGGMFWG